MKLLYVLGALLVAVCAISLVVSAHYYLALRLVLEPQWGAGVERALLALIGTLALALVAAPIAERTLRPSLVRLIAWPATLWMGFIFLLLTTLAASDLLIWIIGAPARAEVSADAAVLEGTRLRALAVGALGFAAGLYGVLGAWRGPRLVRVEHHLARWPRALDGFRIVQISDIHIGTTLGRRFAAGLVERCNALAPDLLAVTGDLVDGSVRRLGGEVEPFADLRARHGVYFVTGNHDHYSGVQRWVEVVRDLGMRVLRNERVVIDANGSRFELAGVDDHRGGVVDGVREDLPRALDGRSPELPLVLLAHDPSTFKRASKMGVDLQLSGHTHGGQIWPFRYLVRLVIPFVAGIYERNGSRLYVSRGTGYWGPPMRLFAPAEITEHVLRSS